MRSRSKQPGFGHRQGPNTFVVGAPKCGTTALCTYLTDHPHVFLPQNKEPHYWADEVLPSEATHDQPIKNWQEYLNLFEEARPQHRVLVDGSTSNLFSERAIPEILKWNQDARLIVMVRNPVDMVVSLHSEEYHRFHEDVEDFQHAWALQTERRKGRHIPRSCGSPVRLQYRHIASLGSQLERLVGNTSPEQRHVVVFDDFAADTAGEYRRVLRFLALEDDGRTDFRLVNPAKRYRHRWLAKWFLYPPRPVYPMLSAAKAVVQALGFRGLRSRILELFEQPHRRPELPIAFKSQLVIEFEEEIQKLEEILHRDFSHWRAA